MRTYLMSLIVILCSACANNWLNLKQSEMILKNDDVSHPTYRLKTDLPITAWHAGLGNESIAAYTEAVNTINSKAGCQIFTKPQHSWTEIKGVELKCWNRIADPDFLGDVAEPEDDTRGLCVSYHIPNTDVIQASVTYIPCYRPFAEEQVLTAVHELMHSLGFGHDRDLGTVMYHSAKWAGDDFDDADLNILRNYYCGNKELQDVL